MCQENKDTPCNSCSLREEEIRERETQNYSYFTLLTWHVCWYYQLSEPCSRKMLWPHLSELGDSVVKDVTKHRGRGECSKINQKAWFCKDMLYIH